jgi:hypothetical protein
VARCWEEQTLEGYRGNLNQANETNFPEQDAVIIIARDYLDLFIDRLTDAIGIPSTKGLTR